MSDRLHENELPRRAFLKASGAVAGAGLLGATATGPAAADLDPLDDKLLNWRVAEARKVWERGYRGRPDRSLGLTDSGIAARHPDVGPWNGVRLVTGDDGGLEPRNAELVEKDVPVTSGETFETLTFSGQNAGAGAVGLTEQTGTFELPARDGEDVVGHGIAATLSWNVDTPEGQAASVEATLQRQVGGEFTDVASVGPDGLTVASSNEHELAVEVPADETYRFEVTTWRAVATWELAVELQTLVDTGETERETVLELGPYDGSLLPAEDADVDTTTPKTVAWYSETTRYGAFDVPRDQNGHGTHVSGIMTATGRASTIDPGRSTVHEEHATLLPTDYLEYEVTADAGTAVFASGLGEGVVIEIVHDGEVLHRSPLRFDSIIADAPTVHDAGEVTYTVRVLPVETEAAVPVAEQAQAGNPLIGRLEKIAVGAYKHPAETTGDRTGDEESVVHSGVAPNFSLAGFQGLGDPTDDLGGFAADAADLLNMRAVNMSWGPLLGAPLSAFGALPSSAPAIRALADAGVLTVAAAGNAWTPANGNGEPAAVGEAISVVATDPFDGITGYSAGGIGQLDEDQTGFDFKPDVTAPGGDIKPDAFATVVAGLPGQLAPVDVPDVGTPTPDNVELVRATANPAPDPDANPSEPPSSDDLDVPRDHRSIGGTSMASPYVCGVAGLVAQAMEEDASESIRLPAPGTDEMDHEATMRLKQVLLSTASTTAFTAAPYHNAQLVPSPATYTHAERDPYEGYGRVNPDAAVDAVTRDLLSGEDLELGGDAASTTRAETVGLDVPFDSRAVAGYVHVPGGDLTATVEFDAYGGGNAGMAKGDPHVDLFVYDAENPTAVGEPNVVDSAVGIDGTAEVSVAVDRGSRDDPTERTFFVVAKLVNVPGVVNGFDVQAHFDLDVSFTPAEAFPLPTFTAGGSRVVDSSVETGRSVKRVDLTVSDLKDDATVADRIPDGWTYLDRFSDGSPSDEGVEFREVAASELEDGSVTFTYFVESPEGVDQSNVYSFGPAVATVTDADVYENDTAEFAGQTDVAVVGADV